jgi:hypothetical protein
LAGTCDSKASCDAGDDNLPDMLGCDKREFPRM